MGALEFSENRDSREIEADRRALGALFRTRERARQAS